YNLIASEDWAAGADLAVSTADTGGNGITVSNVTGVSLDFDGTDDRVVVDDAVFPDLSGAWTIEAWVKPHTTASHNALFTIAVGATDIDMLMLSGGRIEVNTEYDANPRTDNDVITANTWQHIALVADPSAADHKLRLYVNGQPVDFTVEEDAFAGGTFSGNFYIGSRNPGHGTPVWMDGNIDEIRV